MAAEHPPASSGSPAAAAYSRFSLRLVREPLEEEYPRECRGAADLAPFLHRLLAGEPAEVLGVAFFDARGRPFGHAVLFRGCLDRCSVEPRQVFAAALLANAASVLVFHNHPSGKPTPSRADLAITRRLEQAGNVMGIPVRDHLVFGDEPLFHSIHLGATFGLDGRRHPGAAAAPPRARREDRRRQVKPKYRDPDDHRLTWSGRGRVPVWLRERIEAGASLDDFLLPGEGKSERAAAAEAEIRRNALRLVSARVYRTPKGGKASSKGKKYTG